MILCVSAVYIHYDCHQDCDEKNNSEHNPNNSTGRKSVTAVVCRRHYNKNVKHAKRNSTRKKHVHYKAKYNCVSCM